MMSEYKYRFLPVGHAKYDGRTDDAVSFTLEHQLLNEKLWKSFVEVYRHPSDAPDRGWRNEYWGKMMRGACLTYRYTGCEELYQLLEASVKDMLSIHPSSGAFSTYDEGTFFSGWDIWGRKYILTGMQHFYAICSDEQLKKDIVSAMKAHADDMILHIGSGEGQLDITQTSDFWLGVNSCSVLEPIVELYKLTCEKRYLDFAEYIIAKGGCSGENLIKLAVENLKKPFEYPETKAYETMSFFEGLLAYYEVTDNPYYFDAVEKFVDAVADSDITMIGCAGCTHELFDHSSLKQTEYSDGIMQETCVTVTWMRLNARMYLLTGSVKYYEHIERSGYNALYGSMNKNQLPQLDMGSKELLEPLPFDSYSPLYMNRRGRGIGGLKRFSFGGHYGCCACIASAGTALMPLLSVVENASGIIVNGFEKGMIRTEFAVLEVSGDYVDSGVLSIRVKKIISPDFILKIRLPVFAEKTSVTVNGKEDCRYENGYAVFERSWKSGDEIRLSSVLDISSFSLNGKTVFSFGPFVLARDSAKEENDISAPVFSLEKYTIEKKAPLHDEAVRFILSADETDAIVLTDYASCGNDWSDPENIISLWLDQAR